MHTVLSNSSSGFIKLSIEPLMEEIEPVVEKYEFEFVVIKNNIKSKNSRILLPRWKQRISKEILPYKCNVSGWDADVRKRTGVTEENEFEFRGRTIMKAFFCKIQTVRTLGGQGTKSMNFCRQPYSTTKKFVIETFIRVL